MRNGKLYKENEKTKKQQTESLQRKTFSASLEKMYLEKLKFNCVVNLLIKIVV